MKQSIKLVLIFLSIFSLQSSFGFGFGSSSRSSQSYDRSSPSMSMEDVAAISGQLVRKYREYMSFYDFKNLRYLKNGKNGVKIYRLTYQRESDASERRYLCNQTVKVHRKYIAIPDAKTKKLIRVVEFPSKGLKCKLTYEPRRDFRGGGDFGGR
jgi:hypothetical protein